MKDKNNEAIEEKDPHEDALVENLREVLSARDNSNFLKQFYENLYKRNLKKIQKIRKAGTK